MESSSRVTIAPLDAVDDETVAALAELVPQMSSSAAPLTREWVETLVASESSTVYVARLDGVVVGTLTLVVYAIPVGRKAWIEDVVVDESARGQGVGQALVEVALDEARRQGAKAVLLTSRPAREAANRLYQRIGFARYETNLYRFQL